MHLLKVDLFYKSRFGLATEGLYEVSAKYYMSSAYFGVAVNEIDFKSIMYTVLDNYVRETLKMHIGISELNTSLSLSVSYLGTTIYHIKTSDRKSRDVSISGLFRDQQV